MTTNRPTRVFITGVSSGIGEGLALEYAAPGVTLGLVARRQERLLEVKKRCEQRGAAVLSYCVDVSDQAAIVKATSSF
jgi:NADP-dependent 3-hydroxy acid dehydrogenase YdfG